MKTYTLNPHLPGDDNQITITEGITCKPFTRNGKTCYGVDLGYFLPRKGTPVGTPLSNRYFKVSNVPEGNGDEKILNLSISLPGENGMRYGTYITPDTDEDTDHIAVYLYMWDVDGRGRCQDHLELKENQELIEGRCYHQNVSADVNDPATRKIPFSCPSLLVMTAGKIYNVIYRNHNTRSTRLLKICWMDKQLQVVSNTAMHQPSNQLRRRQSTVDHRGSLAEQLSQVLPYDFPSKNDRRRRRHHERHERTDRWN